MKTYLFRVSILVLFLCAAACGKKAETETASDSDEWPAMDSFHEVMADAFHPYKDSANVEPAKKLADKMAAEAAKWQEAPLPKKVDNDEVKGQLEKLKTGTKALADQVKGGASDQEIGNSLTALHDQFHMITEAWYGKHEH